LSKSRTATGTAPRRKRLSAAERREVIERAAMDVFTERGYHRASIDEIARRSGVTPPVVYDHFASKLALHRRLLERTRDELLAMWREHLAGDHPAGQRIPRAFDAWARYVQEHPYAPRMFFHETTGDPEIRAVHEEVQAQSRAALGAVLAAEPGAEQLAGSADPQAMEMAAEVIRAGLTGLAVWWADHPDVPRERIVATAVNAIWIGFERARRGETWPAAAPPAAASPRRGGSAPRASRRTPRSGPKGR
jgi:AcrR family transcriptional regulator